MEKPVQINFDNIDHSTAIQASIESECNKLEQFCQSIIGCEVTLGAQRQRQHHGNFYEIRIRLTLPEAEIVSSRRHQDKLAREASYAAVQDSFRALRRQLEEHTRKRRQRVKFHEPALQLGRVANTRENSDYGVIETPEQRQIYFHRNSLVNAEFDLLEPGDEVRFVEKQGLRGPQASTVYLGVKHHVP